MAIRVESLGGLRVFRNGGELVEFPRQKLRCALLLYLAVERDAARERLTELFWPSREPERARHTLSQMVYELRQALGQDWVEFHGDRLVATNDLRTDVQDLLERVELGRPTEAAAVYRGPFLGSHHLADTPEFERWCDTQRTRFATLYRDAQSTNVDRLTTADDIPGALSAARRWVLADPLDDDAQYRLIALLARCGLRNEALRQYEDYAQRLSWIDAEPLSSVVELVEGMKSGSLAPDQVPRVGARSGLRAEATTGVVVFPILNASKDDANQYFCDGLAEEIMHALGRVPGLRVAPRTSAFAFDQPGVRVSAAVRELGVTHALEGSVRFSGDRYRVRIALIEGAQEAELWADRFDGTLATSDVFELQDRIAGSVLDALAHRLDLPDRTAEPPAAGPSVPPRARRDTVDPAAHELYLRGRHAWFGRTVPDLERALDLFREAVRRDPSYARAHAGIADVYLVLGGLDYATLAPRDLYEKAGDAAEVALQLDPELAQAHAAMGNYLMNHAWDWDAAGERFRHAIELNPGYSTGRQWYSNYLMCLGREDEAIAEATLALEMDPRSVFLSSTLARHYQLMRQPERAAEQFRRALDLDPTFMSAHLGLCLAELQSGQADASLERIRALSARVDRDIPILQALHAYATAVVGESGHARTLVQRLKATRAPYLPPEYVALAYVGLADHERALDWLDKALEVRSQTLTMLKVEPVFDPLRHTLRFKRLLAAIGFEVG